jgi:hypothetical protein
MSHLPRIIYFNTNEGDQAGRYDLGLPGSLEDIAAMDPGPKEGMRVIIYMSEELEMEAFLEFDVQHDRWMAIPIEGTLKYLDDPEER